MKVKVLIPFDDIELKRTTILGEEINISKERYEQMIKNQNDINQNRDKNHQIKFIEVVEQEIEKAVTNNKPEVAKPTEEVTEKAIKKDKVETASKNKSTEVTKQPEEADKKTTTKKKKK